MLNVHKSFIVFHQLDKLDKALYENALKNKPLKLYSIITGYDIIKGKRIKNKDYIITDLEPQIITNNISEIYKLRNDHEKSFRKQNFEWFEQEKLNNLHSEYCFVIDKNNKSQNSSIMQLIELIDPNIFKTLEIILEDAWQENKYFTNNILFITHQNASDRIVKFYYQKQ